LAASEAVAASDSSPREALAERSSRAGGALKRGVAFSQRSSRVEHCLTSHRVPSSAPGFHATRRPSIARIVTDAARRVRRSASASEDAGLGLVASPRGRTDEHVTTCPIEPGQHETSLPTCRSRSPSPTFARMQAMPRRPSSPCLERVAVRAETRPSHGVHDVRTLDMTVSASLSLPSQRPIAPAPEEQRRMNAAGDRAELVGEFASRIAAASRWARTDGN